MGWIEPESGAFWFHCMVRRWLPMMVYIRRWVVGVSKKRKSGTIVNVSSVAAVDALPSCALYGASKFALEGEDLSGLQTLPK